MSGSERVVRVNGRELKLTNLDKILWPDEKISKAEVIQYYAKVGTYMIPFIRDRPLMAQRFPNGIRDEYFVQKHFTGLPRWAKHHTVSSKSRGKEADYLLCNDLPTLIWLANLAALEINQMLARVPSVTRHDIVLIDLDPHHPATFTHAKRAARGLASVLEKLGLEFLLKTSGGDGIHFLIPVEPRYSVEKIRRFVYAIGKLLEKADPKLATVSTKTSQKSSRVYVDFLQNGLEKTITAPFSIRALPSAPVSFPFQVRELYDSKFLASRYTLRSALKRLKDMRQILYLSELAQDLQPAFAKLGIGR